jgi:hypothetical protein
MAPPPSSRTAIPLPASSMAVESPRHQTTQTLISTQLHHRHRLAWRCPHCCATAASSDSRCGRTVVFRTHARKKRRLMDQADTPGSRGCDPTVDRDLEKQKREIKLRHLGRGQKAQLTLKSNNKTHEAPSRKAIASRIGLLPRPALVPARTRDFSSVEAGNGRRRGEATSERDLSLPRHGSHH